MVIIWIGSLFFAVLLAALFRVEWRMLEERHARPMALVLDGGRLMAAMLMFLALQFAEPRPLATIGLGLAAFAFVAVPGSWALSVAGVEPRWELYGLQAEGADLVRRYPSPMPPQGAERLRALVAGLAHARSADTAELCDLLAARYQDWIAGSYRPLVLGRRVIRIYDLQRRLYPDETRPPRLSQEEATLRWRLYRVFGALVECGAEKPERGRGEGLADRQSERCLRLLRELEAYRNPDTAAFIDALQASVAAWLKLPDPRPAWLPAAHLQRGAAARGHARALWPSTAIFWGAILDEGDRSQLRQALSPG